MAAIHGTKDLIVLGSHPTQLLRLTMKRFLALVALCSLLLGSLTIVSCNPPGDDDDDTNQPTDSPIPTPASDVCVDADNDDYCTEDSAEIGTAFDCDDANDNVNPAATEICNGRDDNCDGIIDNGITKGYYVWPDNDLDDYGDKNAEGMLSCGVFKGYASNGNDCNDDNAAINPAACEKLQDGVDNNCDGTIDESINACPASSGPVRPETFSRQ